jgi:hypothetical protein
MGTCHYDKLKLLPFVIFHVILIDCEKLEA